MLHNNYRIINDELKRVSDKTTTVTAIIRLQTFIVHVYKVKRKNERFIYSLFDLMNTGTTHSASMFALTMKYIEEISM